MDTFKNHKYHVGLSIGAVLVGLFVLALALTGLMRTGGQVGPACVAPPPGVVSWWNAEGNANDIWDNNPGTLQNGATFAAGKVGQAFSFDGVDDLVSVPDAPNLRPSTITVDAWVNPSLFTTGANIFVARDGTTGRSWNFQAEHDGGACNGKPTFSMFVGGSNFFVCGTTTLPLNQWSHLAATYDGTTLKMYVNGALEGQTAVVGTLDAAVGQALTIGQIGFGLADIFRGLVDELEIFNRALSSSEIAAIYNAGSAGKCGKACGDGTRINTEECDDGNTVSNDGCSSTCLNEICTTPPSNMVSWWPAENNANDIIDSNPGTLVGGTTFVAGKVGQAFSFDGVDDVVQILPGGVNLNGKSFTVDAWINPASLPAGTLGNIAPIYRDTFGDPVILHFGISNNPQRTLLCGVPTPVGPYHRIMTNVAIPTNAWTHVACTWDGATMRLYVNGQLAPVSLLDGFGSGLIVDSNSGRGEIGGVGDVGYHGLIDEVEILDRALSSSEIQSIYNAGSAGKCIECTPAPSQMVSWWPAENNANDIIDANAGTMQNGATFAAGKVGQAFSFDGVNDFVDFGSGANLNIPGSLTMDFWVNPATFSHLQYLIADFASNGVDSQGSINLGSSGVSVFGYHQAHTDGSLLSLNSLTGKSPNTWYHVAVLRDDAAKTVKLYVNGVLEASGSYAGKTVVGLQRTKQLGRSAPEFGGYFQGLIDEVEIFNRALSTAEIQAIYNAGSAGKCQVADDGDGVAADVDAEANGARTACNDLSSTAQAGTAGDPLKACLAGTPLHFLNSVVKNAPADVVTVTKGADSASIDVAVAAGASGDAVVRACDEAVDTIVSPGGKANFKCGASVEIRALALPVLMKDDAVHQEYRALTVGSALRVDVGLTPSGRDHVVKALPGGTRWEVTEKTLAGAVVATWEMAPAEEVAITAYSDVDSLTKSATFYEKTIVESSKSITYTGTNLHADLRVKESLASGIHKKDYQWGHDSEGRLKELVNAYTYVGVVAEPLVMQVEKVTAPSEHVEIKGFKSGDAYVYAVGAPASFDILWEQKTGALSATYKINNLEAAKAELAEGTNAKLSLAKDLNDRPVVEAGNTGTVPMGVAYRPTAGGPFKGNAFVASKVRFTPLAAEEMRIEKLLGTEIQGSVEDEALFVTYRMASVLDFDRDAANLQIGATLREGKARLNNTVDLIQNTRRSVGAAPAATTDTVADSGSVTGTVTATATGETSVDVSLTTAESSAALTNEEVSAEVTLATASGGVTSNIKKTQDSLVVTTEATSAVTGSPSLQTAVAQETYVATADKISEDTVSLAAVKTTTTKDETTSLTLAVKGSTLKFDATSYTTKQGTAPGAWVLYSSPEVYYLYEANTAKPELSKYVAFSGEIRTLEEMRNLQLQGKATPASDTELVVTVAGQPIRFAQAFENPTTKTKYLIAQEADGRLVLAVFDQAQPSLAYERITPAQLQSQLKTGALIKAEGHVIQSGQTGEKPGTTRLAISPTMVFDLGEYARGTVRFAPRLATDIPLAAEPKTVKYAGELKTSTTLLEAKVSPTTAKAFADAERVYIAPKLEAAQESIVRKEFVVASPVVERYTLIGKGTMYAAAETALFVYPHTGSGELAGKREVTYDQASGALKEFAYTPAVREVRGVVDASYRAITSQQTLGEVNTDFVLRMSGQMKVAVDKQPDLSTRHTNLGSELVLQPQYEAVNPVLELNAATADSWDMNVEETQATLKKVSGTMRYTFGLRPERALQGGGAIVLSAARGGREAAVNASMDDSVVLATEIKSYDFEASEKLNGATEYRTALFAPAQTFVASNPHLRIRVVDLALGHPPMQQAVAETLEADPSDAKIIAVTEAAQGQALQKPVEMYHELAFTDPATAVRIIIAKVSENNIVEALYVNPELVSALSARLVGVEVLPYTKTFKDGKYIYEHLITGSMSSFPIIDFTGDSDLDGVIDIADQCVATPGSPVFNGCPGGLRVSVQINDAEMGAKRDEALLTKVFNAAAGSCADQMGLQNPTNWGAIFHSTDCLAENTAPETNSPGIPPRNLIEDLAIIGAETGKKMVLVESSQSADETRAYLGFMVGVASGKGYDLGFETPKGADPNFIQVSHFTRDRKGVYQGGRKETIQASAFSVVAPGLNTWLGVSLLAIFGAIGLVWFGARGDKWRTRRNR